MSAFIWAWDDTTGEWIKVQVTAEGYLEVQSMPASVVPTRMVAAGLVWGGACYLHWIHCCPSAGNSVWELTNGIIALQPTVLEGFHTSKESHTKACAPPAYFDTGIYLETFTNMTSLTFGISN